MELAGPRWALAGTECAYLDTHALTQAPCLFRNDGATALLLERAEWGHEPALSSDLGHAWLDSHVFSTSDALAVAELQVPFPDEPRASTVRAIARRADGRFVALQRGVVALDGERLFELDFEAERVSFDGDARLLAAANEDGRIRILSVADRAVLATLDAAAYAPR